MARSFEDLRKLSKEELIDLYNKIATSTVPSLDFIADEIQRRENQESNERIVTLTLHMRTLTVLIFILTIANVLVVLFNY